MSNETSKVRESLSSEWEIDFRLWQYLDLTRHMIFRLQGKELAQVSISPEQALVLIILHNAGGSTSIKTIVEATQRRHHAISPVITRMAKQGLVRKTRTRHDKRAYRVSLTDKGDAVRSSLPRDSITNAFSSLGAAEKMILLGYLNRLLARTFESDGQKWDPDIVGGK